MTQPPWSSKSPKTRADAYRKLMKELHHRADDLRHGDPTGEARCLLLAAKYLNAAASNALRAEELRAEMEKAPDVNGEVV